MGVLSYSYILLKLKDERVFFANNAAKKNTQPWVFPFMGIFSTLRSGKLQLSKQ